MLFFGTKSYSSPVSHILSLQTVERTRLWYLFAKISRQRDLEANSLEWYWGFYYSYWYRWGFLESHGFNPWVGKISWRRKWQPIPVVLPGKSHGQRSLVGYRPWGHRELDTTEGLCFTSLLHFASPGTKAPPKQCWRYTGLEQSSRGNSLAAQ